MVSDNPPLAVGFQTVDQESKLGLDSEADF